MKEFEMFVIDKEIPEKKCDVWKAKTSKAQRILGLLLLADIILRITEKIEDQMM